MLSYKITGKGDVITFIHGFCEDLSIWKNAHKYFPNHSILSIDLPGFGRSKKLPKQTIETMAKAVIELWEELEIKSTHVIGHSLGGYIGLEILKQKSNSLKSMTLFHSSIFADSKEKKENRNKTIEFIEKHGVQNFANSFIGTLFFEENRLQHENIILSLNEIVRSTSQDAVIETTKGMRDRINYKKIVEAANIPFFFVVGKNDQAVPLDISLKQISIPKSSQVLFLDKTGHMGMFEQEKKSYTTLNAFISVL